AAAFECTNAGASYDIPASPAGPAVPTVAPDDRDRVSNTACGSNSVTHSYGGASAFGYEAQAVEQSTTAVGARATASAGGAIAIGSDASASGGQSIVIGWANAYEFRSIAIGTFSDAK